jgi:hypothetical protein
MCHRRLVKRLSNNRLTWAHAHKPQARKLDLQLKLHAGWLLWKPRRPCTSIVLPLRQRSSSASVSRARALAAAIPREPSPALQAPVRRLPPGRAAKAQLLDRAEPRPEPLERPELLEQLEPLAALRAQEAPLLPRGAQAVVEARVVQGRALRAAGTWVARLRGLVEPQAEPVRAEEQTSREAAR